jgi:hypothetical protein
MSATQSDQHRQNKPDISSESTVAFATGGGGPAVSAEGNSAPVELLVNQRLSVNLSSSIRTGVLNAGEKMADGTGAGESRVQPVTNVASGSSDGAATPPAVVTPRLSGPTRLPSAWGRAKEQLGASVHFGGATVLRAVV